ncbi:unnamed protein product [Cuscuta campestris]|uniref:Biogenesis of lysosome-related organelles complex 1 subunit 7 n=1 Tax=Cuscuta campestris TaxID=132261 RepID=A0A484MT62_9ASTE|nr:unnamed protein product [Cuscuta campestris]
MSDGATENRQPPDSAAEDELPSDATSIVDDNAGDSNSSASTSSPIGEALTALLSSVIREFDGRADATSRSQDQLSLALDRLTGELDKLLEDVPLPFIMQHAARISGVRKRVTSLNSVLRSIQRRVDNIDRMIVPVGLLHEKNIKDDGGQN